MIAILFITVLRYRIVNLAHGGMPKPLRDTGNRFFVSQS